MCFPRFLTVVLFGFLLGWGGFALPLASATTMSHHAMTTDEGAAADCDEWTGHQGHADHQHQGDHENGSKLSHGGCCAMACSGVVALEPAYLQVKPLEQNPTRVQIVTDDRLLDRSVSPLRRPPKPAA